MFWPPRVLTDQKFFGGSKFAESLCLSDFDEKRSRAVPAICFFQSQIRLIIMPHPQKHSAMHGEQFGVIRVTTVEPGKNPFGIAVIP